MEENNVSSEQAIDQNTAASTSGIDVSKRKDVIDVGGIVRGYLKYWWVFLISLVICGGMGAFYMKKKSPVYLIQGLLMVNQQEDGGMGQAAGMAALMSTMGFGSTTGANPNDEIFKISSHTMMMNLIDTLGLQTYYWQDRGFFKRRANYYHDEPISVYIPKQIADTISVSTQFQLEGPLKGPWTLKVKQNKLKFEQVVNKLPYNVKTPYGVFHLDKTENYPTTGKELNVSALYMSKNEVYTWLSENVSATCVSNKADAIQIDMGDAIIPRGEDIVNAIMDMYNNGREADRTAYNQTQLDFIDARLINLYNELENSESKIEQYKKQNKIVDPEAEATYLFTLKGSIDENIITLQSNIRILEMIQQLLSSPETQYAMIPFNGAPGQKESMEVFGRQISAYNDLIAQHMNLSTTAKGNNTALNNLNKQIDAMRDNILNTISRDLQSARINLQTVEAEQAKQGSRLNEFPTMSHELVTLYRDREVQNAIYAFLLQKREETQIALSQSQPVGKIIDRAYSSVKPVKPNPLVIYGLAFVFGMGIPLVIVRNKALSRNKRSKSKAHAKDKA
ncbi:MAG: hypothetical protein NC217_07235 [Muribaculaceae bacterium]|nr:hypothetical protein [Muribaculaceae bacterium]